MAPSGELVEIDLTGIPFGVGRHACLAALRRSPWLRRGFTHRHDELWPRRGLAAANGLPDAAAATLDETLQLARKLVRLPVPITVEVEAGLGTDPRELAAQLWELGVAGVNLEDGRADHARVDTHWLGLEKDSTIDRARRYADAGADGVFVPGLVEDREIAAVVAGVALPLNVLAQRDAQRLAGLGVRRVSTTPIQQAPTYETVQALATGPREGSDDAAAR